MFTLPALATMIAGIAFAGMYGWRAYRDRESWRGPQQAQIDLALDVGAVLLGICAVITALRVLL